MNISFLILDLCLFLISQLMNINKLKFLKQFHLQYMFEKKIYIYLNKFFGK